MANNINHTARARSRINSPVTDSTLREELKMGLALLSTSDPKGYIEILDYIQAIDESAKPRILN